MVLTLLFGVAFIYCRGDHWSSVIYKNIILFKKDRQFAKQIWTHGPYKICGIFDILSVGEDIILPMFYGSSMAPTPTGLCEI